jgi:hypothetical protein
MRNSLDSLNCFLADMRAGLGPYLAIYLLTERLWPDDRMTLERETPQKGAAPVPAQ